MSERRAAIYARISRDRVGAGLGVDRQRDDCRALAEQLGWTVVAEHTDNDLSAYSGKPRPGYRALLDDLRGGRANAVVAWHTDRLHRSPAELEEYVSVCEAGAVPTHTVKAGPLDLTSPSGRLVARQLGAVARYEVEHAIERAKSAKMQAARAGRFRGGRRAFGFEADGMTVRESEAVVVREVADRVLAGESVRSIARSLNDRGITGTRGGAWTGAAVRDVVLKPRNAALVEHQGEIVASAQWPAIVPEETWRAVRVVLEDPGRTQVRDHARRWLLSGLALCGRCGAPVRIGSAGTNKAHAKPYYRCSGPRMHVSRVAEHVDELVGALVVGRLSRDDAVELLAEGAAAGDDPAALYTDANAVRARMDELAEKFAEGAITARQLTTGTESMRSRLEDLDRRIGLAWSGSALDGLAGAQDAAQRWQELPLERRRAVVDALMVVTILPGQAGRKSGGHYFDPETVKIEWKA
ncbi:recombinase family protein [Actinomycetospora rhizophila]|uniref:Recombinase family protein n=1 Tax=Actinomycetospora rhizophila TaxID=1416876 RepID=A0ABV9ZJ50_9PSEU